MNECERLALQLEHSLNGGAWHGAALLELLEGVTPAQAMAKPVPGGHSIWELVLHLAVWQDVPRRRLEGDEASFEISGPEDWPAAAQPADVRAWRTAIERLRGSNAALAAAIRALPEARLDEPIFPKYSPCYQHLSGVIQHNGYHGGQIAVLKQSLGLPAVAPKQG